MLRHWTVCAALLLTLLAVAGAARRARFLLGPIETELVEAHIQRLSGVRDALPPEGPVGYVSDFDAGASFPMDELAGDLTLSQYALLPRILSSDPEVEWLVGRFRQPALVDEACRRRRLEKVEDFGGGIFLLRRPR
jgi:hypothetical protein